MLLSGPEESPVILPFEGFRERIQEEKAKALDDDVEPSVLQVDEKYKKSVSPDLSQNEPNVFDEERLGAHFRKHKTKPPPYTAEYLTSNRFSPLDEEVRSNAMKNYVQSFAEKNFPFEYENPAIFPESRVYKDDGSQEMPMDVGSGENIYPYQQKGKSSLGLTMHILFLFNV